MSLAVSKESYFWHKLHSLSGVVPVGFYVLQHLSLNSFSLAGPDQYNRVSDFFYSLPNHILLGLEVFVVLIPLLFHAIYGLFITNRAKPNYLGTNYGWSQNRMYWLQRVSGVFLFVFIIYHVITTTGKVKLAGDHRVVDYAAMQDMFQSFFGLQLAFYALGVLAASYHLAYGIWNFCIRWGITVSDKAQIRIQKFSFWMFIVMTGLGLAALAGFLIHDAKPAPPEMLNAFYERVTQLIV
jgi:succinate dehydrogenase / fumarate reductase cytochrome b subunit